MTDKGLNVLLVEDNPGDVRRIQEMLAEARDGRVDLEPVERLSIGLERLSGGDIDIVLLDLSLPDSRGLVTFKRTYDQAPRVPIIVLTGLDDEDLGVQAVREGAQDYLIKRQVDSNLLMRSIRYATERKRAEEARKAVERELEEQRVLSINSDRLRSLGQMAAGIAHELNQPLVGVRGLAEHLLIAMDRGWDLTEEKMQEKLQLIVEQADRMTHIIEHVRTFAREAGRPDLQSVEVNDVIQSALGMLAAQFQFRGVELECELAEDLPLVLANPFSLEEVVLNLLLNARDATEEYLQAGSGTRPQHVRVRSIAAATEGPVKVQVIDRGIGIPQDILPEIFDPFFTTKEPDRGTGLGLSISKSIVEQFGGTLHIESIQDQGTTATVSLPAAEKIKARGQGSNTDLRSAK